MRQVAASAEYKYAIGTDVRNYELESNLDGKRFEDVYAVNLKTGERKIAIKKARWVFGPSPDASHVLYYDEGMFLYLRSGDRGIDTISAKTNATFLDNEDDHNVVKPPRRPIGWSSDSKFVLLSDGWDIWKASADGGAGVNLTGNGKQEKIRYATRFRLDPKRRASICRSRCMSRRMASGPRRAGSAWSSRDARESTCCIGMTRITRRC